MDDFVFGFSPFILCDRCWGFVRHGWPNHGRFEWISVAIVEARYVRCTWCIVNHDMALWLDDASRIVVWRRISFAIRRMISLVSFWDKFGSLLMTNRGEARTGECDHHQWSLCYQGRVPRPGLATIGQRIRWREGHWRVQTLCSPTNRRIQKSWHGWLQT